MESRTVVVIDCETTGVGRHDRIVEIAALTLDPETWEPVDEYDTLINPERDLGPVGLHGITASMVETAPVFSEVAAALARRIHHGILVAHNLPFDSRMLAYEFARLGVSFDVGSGLCTYKATSEKLITACERFGITLDLQHRALADARATAELARKIAVDEPYDLKAATVGHLPHTLNTRTLRREASDVGISEMARIVSLAHYPSSDDALLQYLDALDWVLDDHHIDEQERGALDELADSLGISSVRRDNAHRSYLTSIISAAKRDGVVTEFEQRLISQVMDALNVTDVAMPDVTDLPATSNLRSGMHVCFTGEAIVDGESISRHVLEECAACAGMQPVTSVTKKGCDLLVAADLSSQSGKARKARSYGIPVMNVVDFLGQVERKSVSDTSPFDTESEQRLISQVMDALNVTDVAMPDVTDLPATSNLRSGMHVCFTGEAIVDGESISRHVLEERAAYAGMQPVTSVTKKGCDLLVAADLSSQSGKARKARSYGIPVMDVVDFLGQVERKSVSDTSPFDGQH